MAKQRWDARKNDWVDIEDGITPVADVPGVVPPLKPLSQPGFIGAPRISTAPPSAIEPVEDPSLEDADARELQMAQSNPAMYAMAKAGQFLTSQGSVFDLMESGNPSAEEAAAAALESRRNLAADLDDSTIGDPTRSYGDKAIAYSNKFFRAIVSDSEPTDFFTGESSDPVSKVVQYAARGAAPAVHLYGSALEMVGGIGQSLVPDALESPFTEIRRAGEDIAGLMEQRQQYLPEVHKLQSDKLAQATSLRDAWNIAMEDPLSTVAGLAAEIAMPAAAMAKVAKGLSFAEAIPRIIGLGIGMGLPENIHESLRETGDFDEAFMRGVTKTSVEAFGNLATAGLASPAFKKVLDKLPVVRGAFTQALFTAAGGAYSSMGAMWAGRELVGEEMTPGQAAMAFGMGMFDVKLMQSVVDLPGRALNSLHAAIDPAAFAGKITPTQFDSVHLYFDNLEAEKQAMRNLERHNVSTAVEATISPSARPNYTQLIQQLPLTTLGSGKKPGAPRTVNTADLKPGEIVAAMNFDWLNPGKTQAAIDALKLVIKAPGGDVPANWQRLEQLEWRKTGQQFSEKNIGDHIDRLRGVVRAWAKAFGAKDSYVITDALAGSHKEPVKVLTAAVGAKGKPVTVISVRQSAMFDLVPDPTTGIKKPVFNYQRFSAALIGTVARGTLQMRMAKLTPAARSSLTAEYNRQMALVGQNPQLARAMNLDGGDTPPTFDVWMNDNVARAMLNHSPEVIPATDRAGNPVPRPPDLLEIEGSLGGLVKTMREAFTTAGLDMPFEYVAKAMHFGKEKEIQLANIKAGRNRINTFEPTVPTATWAKATQRMTPELNFMSKDLEALADDRSIPVTERNALLDALQHMKALRVEVAVDPVTGAKDYANKEIDPGDLAPIFDQFRQFREAEAAQRKEFGLAEKLMNKLFSSEQTPEDRLNLRTNKYGWGTKTAEFISRRVAASARLSWASQWFKNVPQVIEYVKGIKGEVAEKVKWSLHGNEVWDQVSHLQPTDLKDLGKILFDASVGSQKIPDVIRALQQRGVSTDIIEAYKGTQKLFGTMRDEQHANEAADLARRAKEEKWSTADYNRQVNGLNQKYDKMRDESYMPRMRFGDWRAIVRKSSTDPAEFHAFENEKELDAFVKLAQSKGRTVSSFKATKDQRALHDEIAMMPYSAFKQVQKLLFEKYKVSYDDQKAVEELAFATSADSSFAKSLLKRDYVPGWSTDILRTIASHTTNFANHMANSKYGRQVSESLASLESVLQLENGRNIADPKSQAKRRTEMARLGVVLEWMKGHREESFNAHKDMNTMASFFFFKSLAGDLPNAIATLQQIPVVVAPRLTSLFGDQAEAWKAIAGATASVGKRFTANDMTPLEMRVNDYLRKRGKLNEGQAREIVSNTSRNFEREAARLAAAKDGSVASMLRIAAGKTWDGAHTVLGFPMHAMESGVREITALAATRLAVKTGMPEKNIPDFVERVLTDTNYDYHRTNKPLVYANKGGLGFLRQFFGLFRTYVENTAFQVLRPTNASKSIPALLLLGGLRGLPGAQDVANTEDLVEIAADVFSESKDYNNSQLEARQLISGVLDSPAAADLVLNGMSRVGYGIPSMLRGIGLDIPDVDMSPVAQLGSIVPGRIPEQMRAIATGRTEQLKGAVGMAGAPAAYAMALLDQMVNHPVNGHEKLLPDVFKNALQGQRKIDDGFDTNRSGVVTERFNTPEMIKEAQLTKAGFVTTRAAVKQDEFMTQRESQIVWENHLATLIDKGKKAYQAGNPEAIPNKEAEDIWDKIYERWVNNDDVPDAYKPKKSSVRESFIRMRRNAYGIKNGLISGQEADQTIRRSYNLKPE